MGLGTNAAAQLHLKAMNNYKCSGYQVDSLKTAYQLLTLADVNLHGLGNISR